MLQASFAAQAATICVGASAGALARWGLGLWLNGGGSALPWGTWLANCLGGLAVGALLAALDAGSGSATQQLWRGLLVTGFCGALTTFSTFSAESLSLLQQQRYAWALAHTALHLLGTLACAAAGMALARVLRWTL